jgi:uncharacterized membrane protein YhhN
VARLRGPFLAVAAADVVLAAAGQDRARWATKPLLMPALLPGRDRRTQVALALCGAGDVALLGKSDAAFRAGLGSFLAGHLAWVVALRHRPGRRVLSRHPAAAAPYVLAWAGLNAFLWRRTGPDRLPVVAYSCALTATALAALDTGDPRTAAGGALFLASDTLLALERFAGVELPRHEGWVMATYVTAQALLAEGGTRSG